MMRLLIRNRVTGFYYAGKRRWVPDPTHGHDFRQVKRAWRCCRATGEDQTEVTLAYDREGLRVRFRIGSPERD